MSGRLRWVEEQRYTPKGLYLGSTIKQRRVHYTSELQEVVILYNNKRVPLIKGGVINTEVPVHFHYKVIV